MPDKELSLVSSPEIDANDRVILITLLQEIRELRQEVNRLAEAVHEIPVDY